MKPRFTPVSWRATLEEVERDLATLSEDDPRLLGTARRYIELQDARPGLASRRVLEVTTTGPGNLDIRVDEAALRRFDRRQAAQLGTALDGVRRIMGSGR